MYCRQEALVVRLTRASVKKIKAVRRQNRCSYGIKRVVSDYDIPFLGLMND